MRHFVSFLIFILIICHVARAEKVALVLSGGGARGFAHIGALKACEEAGFEPDLIVGSSMGAVIGGLYSAGYSAADIERVAVSTDWSGLFLDRPSRRSLFLSQKESRSRHILAVGFDGWRPAVPLALASGQSLSNLFLDLTQRAPYQPWNSFDDLKIPFRALATDLNRGRLVIFERGDLGEVMRASISMPLLFTPYRMDSLLLVDGGVADNLPVHVARELGASYIVAVDATSPLSVTATVDYPWQLLDRVTTMLQQLRLDSIMSEADVLIKPDLGDQGSTDFTRIQAAIDSGYRCAKYALAALPAPLLSTHPRLKSVNFARCGLLPSTRTSAPQSYTFSGINAIPESTLAAIPAGQDGRAKFELLRRMFIDRDLTQAHMASWNADSNCWKSQWDEGRITDVRVDGGERSKPAALLREFPLKPGNLFNLRKAKRGINELYGSDRFETVSIAVQPADSGTNLVIRTTEPASPILRLGAGFSSERKGRGFLEFQNDNLLATGARMRLFGKYGERDEDMSGILTFDRLPITSPIDRITNSYLTTEVRGGWSRQEYSFYDSQHRPLDFFFFERYQLDLALGRAFRRSGILWYAVRFENVRVGGVKSEAKSKQVALGVRLHIDTKDRFQFPRRGVEIKGRYELVRQADNDRRAFNRVAGFFDGATPVLLRTVLHSRLDYGWNDRILPVWGQFGFGGVDQMAGLHESEQFGNSVISLNTELRYDLISRLIADAYVSAVYSVGAQSAESHALPPSEDFLHGVGGSFGLSTFLGPMKFAAMRLLQGESVQAHTIFYLNLGYEF